MRMMNDYNDHGMITVLQVVILYMYFITSKGVWNKGVK